MYCHVFPFPFFFGCPIFHCSEVFLLILVVFVLVRVFSHDHHPPAPPPPPSYYPPPPPPSYYVPPTPAPGSAGEGRFCAQCGAGLRDGSGFCTNCGAKRAG